MIEDIQIALIVFGLPLVAFFFSAITPDSAKKLVSYLCTVLQLVCTVGVIILFVKMSGADVVRSSLQWFGVGDTNFTVGIMLDFQGVTLLFVVSIISFLVNLYSTLYMKGDEGYKKYFVFLALFTFAMFGIILADNLLFVFVFWELVGFSSYLLIGHWYQKDSASKAAKKAFVVNRIGDAGFVISLCIIWLQFKTFDIVSIERLMASSTVVDGFWETAFNGLPEMWLTVMGVGLFLAAVGKSAQFPLQVWLPDAMEGPTPVSALIHAATMVAAGVFLMARVFTFLDGDTLVIMATIGAITAFMGAVAALTQFDIKKVLAYSTVSQLGYMLMGVGIGDYKAALFHLFTHAFFKAALFLAAGSVIHSLHEWAHQNQVNTDVQDMRQMGGLGKRLPITFVTYCIAAFSLMGIPLFSGYLSKDAILVASLNWSSQLGSLAYFIPLLAFGSVLLTAFYMIRQLTLVFFGDFRMGGGVKNIQEGDWRFKVVLVVLAIFSLGFLWSINPLDYSSGWVLSNLADKSSAVPGIDRHIADAGDHSMVAIISTILVAIGSLTAWMSYKSGRFSSLNHPNFGSMMIRMSYNNWYLDKVYDVAIVDQVRNFSLLLAFLERRVIDRMVEFVAWFGVISSLIIRWFDRAIVDGIVNFSAFCAGQIGSATKSFQYGKVQSFIIFAILSLLIIIYLIF